jgi:ribosomal protein L32
MAVPKKKRSQIKTKSRRAIFRHKKFVKRHLEQTSYNNYVLPYREPGLIR